VRLRTRDQSYAQVLQQRYAAFLQPSAPPEAIELDIHLAPPPDGAADQDLQVSRDSGRWRARRGDFELDWDPATRRGSTCHSANPYSIDSALRVLHTFLLARQGGFLLHAASAVRDGSAFLLAGLSGAGKTTIAGLAPPDVTLLSDEVSCVRPQAGAYWAFGTPFAGELARAGANVAAPVAALYLLAQGPQTRVEPVTPAQAARALLRNILFFAADAELVRLVFQSACEFLRQVPVFQLEFAPTLAVWEVIR